MGLLLQSNRSCRILAAVAAHLVSMDMTFVTGERGIRVAKCLPHLCQLPQPGGAYGSFPALVRDSVSI